MSIEYVSAGDIRDDPSDILVVAVCAVPGVMGAGQAKAFADRWPGLKDVHRGAVDLGRLRIGHGYCTWLDRPIARDPSAASGTFGVFFLPTKDDWRKVGRLEWVASGLDSLVEFVAKAREPGSLSGPVDSVATPALGCGLGALDWTDVRPLIESAAGRLPEISWTVYEPGAERRARP